MLFIQTEYDSFRDTVWGSMIGEGALNLCVSCPTVAKTKTMTLPAVGIRASAPRNAAPSRPRPAAGQACRVATNCCATSVFSTSASVSYYYLHKLQYVIAVTVLEILVCLDIQGGMLR